MLEILLIILCAVASFLGSWFSTKKYHQRKWIIDFDDKTNEINLEDASKGKRVEFIQSLDSETEHDIEEELDDPRFKKFKNMFKV